MTDTARLLALLEEWEALKNCGDATSRDKKRALAGTFIHALPCLLAEVERLRAALELIANRSELDEHLGRNIPRIVAEEALNAKG